MGMSMRFLLGFTIPFRIIFVISLSICVVPSIFRVNICVLNRYMDSYNDSLGEFKNCIKDYSFLF